MKRERSTGLYMSVTQEDTLVLTTHRYAESRDKSIANSVCIGRMEQYIAR